MRKEIVLFMVVCAAATALVSGVQGASLNGAGGNMPAYYDGKLYLINFMELSSKAETATLAHNGNYNFIYQSDPGLPGGQPFVSVIDAIPGDGFNPLWLEVQVAFTAGHTPRQLYSDTEIDAAVGAGEITLEPTGEMYRCSVMGIRRLSLTGTGGAPTAVRSAGGTTPAGAAGSSTSTATTWGAVKATYR